MSVPAPRAGTPDNPESSSVPVMFARLEAKLDVALAQQGAAIDDHDKAIDDHETRLRLVEARPTVSPRALWSAVAGAAGLFAALSPLLERLYSLHP